jgi:hypothetical protein
VCIGRSLRCSRCSLACRERTKPCAAGGGLDAEVHAGCPSPGPHEHSGQARHVMSAVSPELFGQAARGKRRGGRGGLCRRKPELALAAAIALLTNVRRRGTPDAAEAAEASSLAVFTIDSRVSEGAALGSFRIVSIAVQVPVQTPARVGIAEKRARSSATATAATPRASADAGEERPRGGWPGRPWFGGAVSIAQVRRVSQGNLFKSDS